MSKGCWGDVLMFALVKVRCYSGFRCWDLVRYNPDIDNWILSACQSIIPANTVLGRSTRTNDWEKLHSDFMKSSGCFIRP